MLGPKKDHNMYYDFKTFVQSRRLNYIDYDELDEPQLIEAVRALNVDAAVVCSFNYKIPRILLESTKDGFINVHPSMLPKYRGGNPYSRVLINGETETGVTIHFMDVMINLTNSEEDFLMSELKGACIFGQSGGPTSVINASAYGVIHTALQNPNITRVLGAEHGIKGVLNDRLFDMGQELSLIHI